MTLSRWQRICAWSALVAGLVWTAKFLLLLAGAVESQEPLTSFLMPTAGSVLGVVAALGVAVPFLRQQPPHISLPVVVVAGLMIVIIVSALSNAAQGAVSEAGNDVVRTETSALVTGAIWLGFAAWMFIAGDHERSKGPGQASARSVSGRRSS